MSVIFYYTIARSDQGQFVLFSRQFIFEHRIATIGR